MLAQLCMHYMMESFQFTGETRNLKQRIEHLLESEMWSRFNVDTIRIWDVAQELDQFALRSFLVTTQQLIVEFRFSCIGCDQRLENLTDKLEALQRCGIWIGVSIPMILKV